VRSLRQLDATEMIASGVEIDYLQLIGSIRSQA